MQASDSQDVERWDEQNSGTFVDYGDVFVPERELQREIIARIVSDSVKSRPADEPALVADLGCGAGGLSKEILSADSRISVMALDASPTMLAEAGKALGQFGARVNVRTFNLEDTSWLQGLRLEGCVSSLAIHHLDEKQKQRLYGDVFQALVPGAPLVIADLVKPSHPVGWQIAAMQWDRAVEERAAKLDQMPALEYFRRVNWNNFSDPVPDPVDKPSGLLEQLNWLSAIGYAMVDVYWMDGGHAIFGGFKPG